MGAYIQQNRSERKAESQICIGFGMVKIASDIISRRRSIAFSQPVYTF
jgi:hypothetical protein